MFDSQKNWLGQFEKMKQWLKDEDFRAFLSHPKVQELLKDDEFRKTLEEKNMFKLMANPKISALMSDPETRSFMMKLHSKSLS